jgi:hypothetical protein
LKHPQYLRTNTAFLKRGNKSQIIIDSIKTYYSRGKRSNERNSKCGACKHYKQLYVRIVLFITNNLVSYCFYSSIVEKTPRKVHTMRKISESLQKFYRRRPMLPLANSLKPWKSPFRTYKHYQISTKSFLSSSVTKNLDRPKQIFSIPLPEPPIQIHSQHVQTSMSNFSRKYIADINKMVENCIHDEKVINPSFCRTAGPAEVTSKLKIISESLRAI